MEKIELGPIQKAWIADLRKYPERQGRGKLGSLDSNGNYRDICCLGQALITLKEYKGEQVFTSENEFLADIDHKPEDTVMFTSYLTNSYKELGLISQSGEIINDTFEHQNPLESLAYMNDNGKTWAEIADFIEKNPEKVFTHSV